MYILGLTPEALLQSLFLLRMFLHWFAALPSSVNLAVPLYRLPLLPNFYETLLDVQEDRSCGIEIFYYLFCNLSTCRIVACFLSKSELMIWQYSVFFIKLQNPIS